ncbi:hypothetical protein ACFSW8_14605 [Rubritalea tangerina]|uniref:Chromosome partition protein Smc n=2 Tax=Rubritalea tangerina TaxID=430798 RepID=A0ABW4ZDZ1_9BACT
MKPLPIAITTLSLTMGAISAQTEAPAKEKEVPMTLEERKASIPSLENHISERRGRLEEISVDVLRLDDRLEKKVDNIVNKLASLKDSESSRRRVSQIKMAAMEGLVKDAKEYQSKRAELIRELQKKKPSQPKDMVEGDVQIVDDRVEKRVEQVLLLSKSFSQERDVKKYTNGGGGYYGWGGGWNSNERVSEEWRQNNRDKSMNKKQRDAVKAALEKSITRYESLANGVEQKLKSKEISAEYRELLMSEQAHYNRVLENRKRQLADFVLVEQPHTKAISQREALDVERALDDAVNDFDSDIRLIKQKYAEIVDERRKIQKLESNLKARKQWLIDYEAGKVKLPTE